MAPSTRIRRSATAAGLRLPTRRRHHLATRRHATRRNRTTARPRRRDTRLHLRRRPRRRRTHRQPANRHLPREPSVDYGRPAQQVANVTKCNTATVTFEIQSPTSTVASDMLTPSGGGGRRSEDSQVRGTKAVEPHNAAGSPPPGRASRTQPAARKRTWRRWSAAAHSLSSTSSSG